MRARVVVFPIKGRNWCFARTIGESVSDSQSASNIPSTFKQLWQKISSSSSSTETAAANAQLVVDFAANKMNRAWAALEKAPSGSLKSKIHGLGLRLLSRVKPSEIFLKSIPKEVTNVEVVYPSSLNARLVRRRLRHIALRGTVIHKKFFYGSVTLLPITTAFTVLPLPNIPFFWILFRTYSHWTALKGSEKLLQLVSDSSENQDSSLAVVDGPQTVSGSHSSVGHPWVLQPSKELEQLLRSEDANVGLSPSTISEICKTFDLHKIDVLKYQKSL